MDFSRVALSDEDRSFRDELRSLLSEIVTDEVIARDRETGENFDESVHLALGKAGYLAADFRTGAEGGFSRVRKRIWDLEIGRAHTPWFHWGTTAMVARAVEHFGSPELKEEVLERTLAGEFRLCLGYTEPEGGSDVATAKTRAVRDDDARSPVPRALSGPPQFARPTVACDHPHCRPPAAYRCAVELVGRLGGGQRTRLACARVRR